MCCSSASCPSFSSRPLSSPLTTSRPPAACDVWKHTTCYGFNSAEDSRIPDMFVCYRCLAHKALDEAAYEADKEGEIEQALAEFRSLALFRRGASLSSSSSLRLSDV